MTHREYFYQTMYGKASSNTKLSPEQEKFEEELRKKQEEEQQLIAAFTKALAIPKESIRKNKEQYYLVGSSTTPFGTLNLNSRTAASHYPLRVKSLSPLTKPQLIANLTSLLTATPIPESFDRKRLSPIILENNQFVLDVNKCLATTLKWAANVIKQQNKDMQWLPIIQDLLWMEWGWKKKLVTKKTTKKVQKKANIQEFLDALDDRIGEPRIERIQPGLAGGWNPAEAVAAAQAGPDPEPNDEHRIEVLARWRNRVRERGIAVQAQVFDAALIAQQLDAVDEAEANAGMNHDPMNEAAEDENIPGWEDIENF